MRWPIVAHVVEEKDVVTDRRNNGRTDGHTILNRVEIGSEKDKCYSEEKMKGRKWNKIILTNDNKRRKKKRSG